MKKIRKMLSGVFRMPERKGRRMIRAVAGAIAGAFLYGLFNYLLQDTILPGITFASFRLQIVIVMLTGLIFGPLAGFLAGFLGNMAGDYLIGYGALTFVQWHAGNGIIGLVMGFYRYFRISRIKSAYDMGILIMLIITGNIIGIGFSSFIADVYLINRLSLSDAYSFWFLPAAMTNIIAGIIVLPVILLLMKRIVLNIETRFILVISLILIISQVCGFLVLSGYYRGSHNAQYTQETSSGPLFDKYGSEDQEKKERDEVVMLYDAGTIIFIILMLGLTASIYLSKRLVSPLKALTKAAVAVEKGKYEYIEPSIGTGSADEIGRLISVFNNMVKEVDNREERLKTQVDILKLKIDKKEQSEQVDRIIQSDYFKKLKSIAKDLKLSRGEKNE